ncbi:MAG: recombinase family protein [Vampirovibrio sp.]|nr:recombinase family protein [Vampirovibrio sp.]
MKRNNCAIYIRKSSEKGLEQDFNSLHNQEDACKAYILSQAYNGWQHYKTYEDGGLSGGSMKRPALQALLKDMENGIIQTVVVYKVDRLSRSILDFYKMMQTFDKHDCSFVSITQSFDTSNSMGKLTLNMLLSFAQFEREVSSERIRDKIQASKAKGLWTGGPCPLGYTLEEKKLQIHSQDADLVRQIFTHYLKLQTVSNVKQWLKENGYKGKKGVSFSTSGLHRILSNPLYTGKIVHKRLGKVYEGQHEPIISEAVFEQVQNQLKQRFKDNEARKVYTLQTNLLKGVFYTEAGELFKYSNAKKHQKRFNYYAVKGCYLPAEQIDEQVLQGLAFLNLTQDTLKSSIAKVIYTKQKDIGQLEIHLTLDDKLGKLKLPPQAVLSMDQKTLILSTSILINNQAQTTLRGHRNKRILSIHEMNEQLIQGLSLAWHYRTQWKQGVSVQDMTRSEASGKRKIQKYLALTLLSPPIIESILNYQNPQQLTLTQLIDLAESTSDFEQQELAWFGL